MTAEVAILNKTAVALAADSAVTIKSGDGVKIYNTLKLFNLCRSSSVGIMVYNNAEFTSVPWETIIKQYRKQLNTATFPTLEEYAEDFIAYLSQNRSVFSEDLQKQSVGHTVHNYYYEIVSMIDAKITAATRNDRIGASTIRRITRQVINDWHDKLQKQPFWQSITPGLDQRILQTYNAELNNVIDRVFQPLPLSPVLKKRLRTIAAWLLTKDLLPLEWLPQLYSGLVIAGFGENDIYPAVTTFNIESLVLNELRYVKIGEKSTRITPTMSSTVVAFAQEDVVAGFMEGIDRKFHTTILLLLFDMFNDYAEEIAKHIPGLRGNNKKRFVSTLKSVSTQLITSVNNSILAYKWKRHIEPIVDAVAVLPKEELASMASALVSLTSTKRRVTMDLETVGGPIDVAVISKGDGFIWVNRKHYFEPDKNPQFFSRFHG
jgi:hypothetical protein